MENQFKQIEEIRNLAPQLTAALKKIDELNERIHLIGCLAGYNDELNPHLSAQDRIDCIINEYTSMSERKLDEFNHQSDFNITFNNAGNLMVEATDKIYDGLSVVDCKWETYGILNSVLQEKGIKTSPFSSLNPNNKLILRNGNMIDLVHNLDTLDADLI